MNFLYNKRYEQVRYHLISINCRYSHSCLAQFYLRHALEKHLPEAQVLLSQFTINDPFYKTLLAVCGQKADVLFFSVYIWNHGFVERLIHDITVILPEMTLVLGGPQVAFLADLPAQCTVVTGEIEGIDPQFYHDLEQACLQPVYKAGACREFPSPYMVSDYTGPLKNRQLYYESSRGCPFFCSYCLSSITHGVRHKPLDLVCEELQQLLATRPMIIKFVDRTFNDDPKRALAIWQFLQKQGLSVKCHFEIAPDRFSEQMFAFLATVDCDLFQFEIGIQSCNDQTLDAVNRRMDRELALKNIRRLVAFDTIHLHVDLILGLPYETRQTFKDSFCRVFESSPHYIQLGLLKVLPGTAIAAQAGEYGLVYCHEPPYEVLATRWLSHGELSDLYAFCECVEAFYNNRFFRSLWKYLVDIGENPFSFFQGLLDCCRSHDFFNRAATHAFMQDILGVYVATRPDHVILHEILAYDWLRCGHRTLPVNMEDMSQKELRNKLRLQLPQNLPGVFDYQSRVEFLKQSSFLRLSGKAVFLLTGNDTGPAIFAFLPGQRGGVMKHCQTVMLPQEIDA